MKKPEPKLEIQENIPLAPLTTMGVGGVAKKFVAVKSLVELVQAVQEALDKEIPYLILGGGSNVIISDAGFPGLVIKNEADEILVDEAHSIVQADSGVKSGRLAAAASSAGLSGLEWLFGIPGTVGGAVYGNAGIRGHETKDVLKDIVCLSVKESTSAEPTVDTKAVVVKRDKSWLEYEYRGSRLKRDRDELEHPPVILSARFQLYPARPEVIASRTKEFLDTRYGQPKGRQTAGCVFRNPSTDPQEAAGRLLDLAGAKRLTVGGAAVSREHANFIYNKKKATATEIKKLIDRCHDLVLEKYQVDLKREVELIGAFDEEKY